MDLQFNRKSEKRPFIYRPHPDRDRGYLILKHHKERQAYDPVGIYLVLDREEDRSLTEKKMTNLISILNERKEEVIHLGDLTGTRLLYSMIPETTSTDKTAQIVFRTYDGKGVSRENAVLTLKIEKGVNHEDIITRTG